MSNDQSQTEKLIDYLDDHMDSAEKAMFQTELATNEAMQKELGDLLLARDLVKNHGLASQVASVHQKMMAETDVVPNKPIAAVRPLYARVMKYAAVAILLLGLFSLYQYFDLSSDKLYNEQYNAYTLTTFRGDETISVIEKAYTEKRYDEVISSYQQLQQATIKETFIAGQAWLARENYPAAAGAFKTVIAKNDSAHTGILLDDAEYYLALTYLKNNEPGQALDIFKKIQDNKHHLYNSKVSSWFLKKLRVLSWKKR